ncbi:PDZ domain-containing protein [Sphingomonas abietis]|uniref:PDZ domain-containing protein n=1 Tax=Sphingomonas abietis TaxID=3012344 RepID=A0ABY7NNJ6_9SPHN|nr:PDZ domain-containing protein [Sphingomonas abietis]WBO22051.1 PDZ domain-containing protein [Sphingomonas abietis]
MAALLLVVILAERGLFTHLPNNALPGGALPGITLGDDSDDRVPVVTSVRSNGEAERAGIRAGDEIESVDGHMVHDVAALRTTVLSDRTDHPLALHIRRGDALWTVALDRAEPSAGGEAATDTGHGAENPSD